MVFSFNFASPEEEMEGKGEKRKIEEEKDDAVVWRQAREVLLKDSHLERIGSATFAHVHTMHICTQCTLHHL